MFRLDFKKQFRNIKCYLKPLCANKNVALPIVFVHIPKTAGTSFRLAMVKEFCAKKLCLDYRGGSNLISKEVKDYMVEVHDPASFSEAFALACYSALSGHYPVSRYSDSFPPLSFVSFVREPVSRLISLYRHKVRHSDLNQEFDVFVEDESFQNAQSKMLSGIPWPAIGFVGVTERYSESLELINRLYRSSFKELNKNNAPSKAENSFLSQQEWVHVTKVNAKDIELYEKVNRYLDIRMHSLESGYEFIRAWFSISDAGEILLYALPNKSTKEIGVQIFYDDSLVDELRLDASFEENSGSSLKGEWLCKHKQTLTNYKSEYDVEIRLSGTGQPLLRVNEPFLNC